MTLTAKTLIFISTMVFVSTPSPTVIETSAFRHSQSIRLNIEYMISITEKDIQKLENKVDSILISKIDSMLVSKIDSAQEKITEHDTTEVN